MDQKTAPWPSISEAGRDIVRRLLTRDPAKRPTAAEILQVGCRDLLLYSPSETGPPDYSAACHGWSSFIASSWRMRSGRGKIRIDCETYIARSEIFLVGTTLPSGAFCWPNESLWD